MGDLFAGNVLPLTCLLMGDLPGCEDLRNNGAVG